MSKRFFVDSPITGTLATLAGAEAHHLLHVMRAGIGEEIVLFDGSGSEFVAEILRMSRAEVEVAIRRQRAVDRELSYQLNLYVALPKGDRQRWLVEKCTELGVTKIVPIITQRQVAQPHAAALKRLRKGVIEASKQCGRNRLLEVAPAIPFAEMIETVPPDELRLLADPAGKPLASDLAQTHSSISIAIGPEGGFSAEEVSAAENANWQTIALGERILRIETAAVWIAALVAAARL